MLKDFVIWLGATHFSLSIQTSRGLIQAMQTFHILALAVVMTAAWVLNLRIAGFAGRRHSVAAMANRFMPWIWWAVIVLVISGVMLVIAEPKDTLLKSTFQIKMALLAGALAMTFVLQSSLRRDPARWDRLPVSSGARIFGIVALAMWVAVAIAGRMIAYIA